MSVLIRGMEMPKSCLDCKLCYDAFYCKALGIGFYVERDKEHLQEGFDPETARLQGCPLVHVPAHGRLIDADALRAEFQEPNEENGGWRNPDEALVHKTGVWAAIDTAPTIIPAEPCNNLSKPCKEAAP